MNRLCVDAIRTLLAGLGSFAVLRAEETSFVDGMPWQGFLKDDYVVVFSVSAPVTADVLAGLLSTLSESPVTNHRRIQVKPISPPLAPHERGVRLVHDGTKSEGRHTWC